MEYAPLKMYTFTNPKLSLIWTTPRTRLFGLWRVYLYFHVLVAGSHAFFWLTFFNSYLLMVIYFTYGSIANLFRGSIAVLNETPGLWWLLQSNNYRTYSKVIVLSESRHMYKCMITLLGSCCHIIATDFFKKPIARIIFYFMNRIKSLQFLPYYSSY